MNIDKYKAYALAAEMIGMEADNATAHHVAQQAHELAEAYVFDAQLKAHHTNEALKHALKAARLVAN